MLYLKRRGRDKGYLRGDEFNYFIGRNRETFEEGEEGSEEGLLGRNDWLSERYWKFGDTQGTEEGEEET